MQLTVRGRNIQYHLGKQLQCRYRLVIQHINILKGEFVSQCLLESRLNQVFLLRFCLCLAVLFLFINKKTSLVRADEKHSHKMKQPPPCLKICSVYLNDVLCWIFPKHNTLYSGQKVNVFATCFAVLLKCFIEKRMDVLEYFILYRLPSFHCVIQVRIVE